jgi:hypothetical protein
MTSGFPTPSALVSVCYAALRHGGAPACAASAQLDLSRTTAEQLERLFQLRPGGGAGAMRPRFARHEAHVSAVLAEGGYPALQERGR